MLSFRVVSTALMRGGATFLSFLLAYIVAKLLDSDTAGLFFYGLSLSTVFGVFFRFGTGNVLIRIFASHGLTGYSVGWLNIIFLVLVSILIFLFGALWFLSDVAADFIYSDRRYSVVIFWFSLSSVFVAAYGILGFVFQGLEKSVLAVFFQTMGVSIVFVLAVFLFFIFDFKINYTILTEIYFFSAVLVFIFSVFVWWRISADFDGVIFKLSYDKSLILASRDLWLASCMMLLVQWSGVLIAGIFVSGSDLAGLSIAQRTAGLITFVLMLVNMLVAPKYAKMWSDKNLVGMKGLARKSTIAMASFSIPMFFVFLFFSEYIMSVFGSGYENYALILVVISFGQLVNVLTGSVSYLLNMTGHERDYRNITFLSGLLTLLLSFVLTAQYGVNGAAMATAIGLCIQNLFGFGMVRRRLGFWPFG